MSEKEKTKAITDLAIELRHMIEINFISWERRYAVRYIVGRIIDGKYDWRVGLAMIRDLFRKEKQE